MTSRKALARHVSQWNSSIRITGVTQSDAWQALKRCGAVKMISEGVIRIRAYPTATFVRFVNRNMKILDNLVSMLKQNLVPEFDDTLWYQTFLSDAKKHYPENLRMYTGPPQMQPLIPYA